MFSGIFGILRFYYYSVLNEKFSNFFSCADVCKAEMFHLANRVSVLRQSLWKKVGKKSKNFEWNSISRSFSTIGMYNVHELLWYIATINANKMSVLTFWLIMKMKDVLPCDDWIMSYGSLAHGHIDEGFSPTRTFKAWQLSVSSTAIIFKQKELMRLSHLKC